MKIIRLLILSFILTGCGFDVEVEVKTQEKDIRVPLNSVNEKLPYSKVIRFTYNSHDYIKFDGIKTGVVHDPDCRKCNKK